MVLVRDAPELQVFLLRRHLASAFGGGAYVFPGGAVDGADRDGELEARCLGLDDATASAALGVPAGGLAFWVAAVRECFEEAGILLARHVATGEVVDFGDPVVETRFADHRRAVHGGERTILDVVRAESLLLDVAGLHYYSHWITPVGAPRRFDTRFFVAAAPPGQTPLADQRETVASAWLTPSDALRRFERGEMELMPPTVHTLESMARFDRAADVLAAAAALAEIPTIQARIVRDGDGTRFLLPGDPGYDEAEEASEQEVVAAFRAARAGGQPGARGA